MNNLKKQLILGCAAISLTSFALLANAQERTKCKDQANPHECHQIQMEKFQAMRATKWHDELKITPEQEPAWKAFVQSFPQLGAMKKEKSANTDAEKISAPERLERHLAKMEKRHALMQAHLATLKTLYGQLTPEQQTLLDTRVAQFEKKRHHRHHGHQQQKQ